MRCQVTCEYSCCPHVPSFLGGICLHVGRGVDPQLKGGNLGSWMATKDASLNAAENDFPIEI